MLTSGQIFIMGEEVTALPAEKRAKHLSRVSKILKWELLLE